MLIRYLAPLILSLTAVTNGQESPCPRLFRYEFDGYQWSGIIRIPSTIAATIFLQIEMSVGTNLPPNQVGRIETVGSEQDVLQQIENGGVITYKVYFPVPNPVPKVTSIKVNGVQYCQGPPEDFSSTVNHITTINLQHNLATRRERIPLISSNNNNENIIYNNAVPASQSNYYGHTNSRPEIQTEAPQVYYPPPTQQPYVTKRPIQITTARPIQTTTTRPVVQYTEPQQTVATLSDYEHCGIPAVEVPNSLITGGTDTVPGEWPWMAALYISDRKGTLSFVCSGSLVSAKHIITAAHCTIVQRKLKSTGFVIKLGIHSILNWAEENQKIVRPEQIITHPEYNSIQNNDIAIIIVPTIQFTNFIRPVCIWESTESANGRTGTVVGWGKDENQNSVSPELKKADATVVSTPTCRSKYPYLEPYTTENTLCAGNEDGTGPCNGDSGGGLYIKRNGYWFIRGVVSNNIPDPNTNEKCKNFDFVIYTDVYKFLNWLKIYMR